MAWLYGLLNVKEIVQSFYEKKGVYLKQIATKGIFTGFWSEFFCEQYIKSPKKSLKGKTP